MKNEKLIALYFDGKLNADQKTLFDSLMSTNAKFKAQVILEQETKTAIISIKKDHLKHTLQQLEQSKKTFKFYKIALAASLVIALGIFGLSQQNSKISNDTLFAQHFKPYTNIITPTSRGNETLDEKNNAFRNYDARNYEIASNQFNRLYLSSNTSYYLFYQGICELQLGNTQKAITLFEARKNDSDKLSNHNTWYLALAYLKNKNSAACKLLLKEIISKKSYKYKIAEDILKKIK